jgi:hypothetical protein
MGGSRAAAALCIGALMAASACASSDSNQVMPPVVLGMTSDLSPVYDDGELKLYEVQIPVELPILDPQPGAVTGNAVDPFPDPIYLHASDVRIEIRFTLSNLDDTDHNVELLVDPWNEFVRYQPGVIIVDNNAIPDFSGYDKRFVVPAKSRVGGALTPDDTTELEVDLATAMAVNAHPPSAQSAISANQLMNRIFNLQNRSNDGDPLLTPYIPAEIPGLTGFDLGLRTEESATLAVEIVVDITDLNGNRVLPPGTKAATIGKPSDTLTPPGSGALQ